MDTPWKQCKPRGCKRLALVVQTQVGASQLILISKPVNSVGTLLSSPLTRLNFLAYVTVNLTFEHPQVKSPPANRYFTL